MLKGIYFDPSSNFAKLCEGVIVQPPPNQVIPHTHKLKQQASTVKLAHLDALSIAMSNRVIILQSNRRSNRAEAGDVSASSSPGQSTKCSHRQSQLQRLPDLQGVGDGSVSIIPVRQTCQSLYSRKMSFKDIDIFSTFKYLTYHSQSLSEDSSLKIDRHLRTQTTLARKPSLPFTKHDAGSGCLYIILT